jgi:hypothetical protein
MIAVRAVARLVDSSGNPIVGRTVYFYVSGDGSVWELIGEASTDDDGYVSVVYSVSGRTWFKASFEGDEYYKPASAVAVWEPPEGCEPVVRTGVGLLDRVVFCVGRYGVTVAVLLVAFVLLLLLVGRRR